MNGWGFSIGTMAGMISAIAFKAIAPVGVTEYTMFMVSSGASLLGTIVGTLLTEPTDEETLQNFYIKTRPFGTWGKFKNNLDKKQQMAIEAENKRDIFSTFIAVPWQVTLFLFMMSLMFKTWTTALILGGICGILTIILYFSWYKHLSTNE